MKQELGNPSGRTELATGQDRKPKKEIRAEKNGREISAGLVVFRRTNEGPKFLLLYHGGRYWNFPKGKIEAEEKSLEAAVRETGEETGLKTIDLRLKKKFKAYERFTFYRNKKRIFKIVIFYLAETRRRQIRVSSEHEGFGWFLYKDAQVLLKSYKDSETVLRQAHRFLLARRNLPADRANGSSTVPVPRPRPA